MSMTGAVRRTLGSGRLLASPSQRSVVSSARVLSSSFSRRDPRRGSRVTRVTSSTPSTRRSSLKIHERSHEDDTTTRLSYAATPESLTELVRRKEEATKELAEAAALEASSAVSMIPINVPRDPEGVLDNATGFSADRAKQLFAVQAIVVVRQLEMLNLFLGYQLLSPEGVLLGYLLEEDLGFGQAMARQFLRTHRAFKATVIDTEGNVILIIQRPFSWINSRIFISIPGGTSDEPPQLIGEAQQEWHVYRRKYNHFVKRGDTMVQFGTTDSGFLAWDFYIQNEKGETIGSINRNFTGFGRELFTDTGQYVLRFEGVLEQLVNPQIESPPAPTALSLPLSSSNAASSRTGRGEVVTIPDQTTPENSKGLVEGFSSVPANLPVPAITFDERAVMLASAVSIDFDYFTRQRGGYGHGLFMPIPIGAGAPPEPTPSGTGVPGPMDEGGENGTASNSQDTDNDDDDWMAGEESAPDRGIWSGSADPDRGGWSDEVMRDPWENGNDHEEGGTWGWNDLFPGDSGDGGGGDGY